MRLDKLRQWGGPTAIVGGMIWCLFWLYYTAAGVELYPSRMGLLALPAFSAAFLALGLVALYGGAETKLGAVGKVGVLLAAGGTTVFALGALIAASVWPTAYGLAILGEFATTLGLLVFAVANLGDQVLSRWNALPLLLALVYPPSWMPDPGSLPPALRIMPDLLAALYGLGWVLLGYRLWLDFDRVGLSAASSRPEC